MFAGTCGSRRVGVKQIVQEETRDCNSTPGELQETTGKLPGDHQETTRRPPAEPSATARPQPDYQETTERPPMMLFPQVRAGCLLRCWPTSGKWTIPARRAAASFAPCERWAMDDLCSDRLRPWTSSCLGVGRGKQPTLALN